MKPNRVELEKLLAELERLKASGEYRSYFFFASGFSPWKNKLNIVTAGTIANEFGITLEEADELFFKSKPNVDDQIAFVRSLLAKCEPATKAKEAAPLTIEPKDVVPASHIEPNLPDEYVVLWSGLSGREVALKPFDRVVYRCKDLGGDNFLVRISDGSIHDYMIGDYPVILYKIKTREQDMQSAMEETSKYHRTIKGVTIDVYDILAAYKVESHAVGHAVKKLLMAGQRGAKDRATDLEEAITAIRRAMEVA